MRWAIEVLSTVSLLVILQLVMATGTRAVVSNRSQTWERATGCAWHLGKEEGAEKQGLSLSFSPQAPGGEKKWGQFWKGRDNLVHLEEGRKHWHK